ncbi:MAG: nuclear transport factor 2 family protein [Candidatus Acidiferrum sp.]
MADQQEAQKKFVARWFEEVWNQSRRAAIDEMFPEDAVLHDGRNEYRGPAEFKRFYDALRAQLSEIRVTPLETISEGDIVCMRWSSTAKHSSTGKHLEVTGMSILRFKDGRFVEAWQNWDQHGLLQQLEDAATKSFFQAAG